MRLQSKHTILTIAAIGLLELAGTVPRANAQTASLKSVPLVIGLSHSTFIGVNQADAEASFRAFMISAGQKRGYLFDLHPIIYNDTHQFREVVRTNPPHVAVMDAWEFAEADLGENMEARYVVTQRNGLMNSYVLLANRRSELKSLADLRGKELTLLEAGNAKLGRIWLEVLLSENNLPTARNLLGAVETVGKPSAAVLPVFFGKKSACVIPAGAFKVLQKMNPQVGHDLLPLAVSPGYLETLICIGKVGWNTARQRDDFLQSLEEFHQHPAGQQVLNLFKADRVAAFQPVMLDSLRELRARYDRLQSFAAVRSTKAESE